MKYKIKIVSILLIVTFLIQGCTSSNKNYEENIIIAVSIVPEAAYIEAICGDKVDVVTMIPPGMSPENYEPSPEQIALFQEADLYFSIGVPTEEANIYSEIGKDTRIVRLHEIVGEIYEDRYFEDGGRDPHIWLSIKRVKVMVETMTEEICKIDEKNRAYYETNEVEYLKQLEVTNQRIESLFEKKENASFIAYHPAFGYIADDYGLQMYTLEENGKEATVKHLQEIIDIAKEKQIEIIFYQSEVDSRQSRTFAEEIDGEAVEMAPLAANFLENMEEMAKKIVEGMK